MYYLRLIGSFARVSTQAELAHRTNYWISLLHSGLNLLTGILGVAVIFGQVESLNGWNFSSTLAVLGVYLTVSALQRLFISPSLEALAGMDGEVWTGKFDFTLLRPVDVQLQASLRYWQPFALVDLLLGLGVVGVAVSHLEGPLTLAQLLGFGFTLGIGVMMLYSILLFFTGLVFRSPGFLFTWVFSGIFQMARYPIGVYPDWIRLVLTWIIPLGFITTVPAQALGGGLQIEVLVAAILMADFFFLGATAIFRFGLRRYESASS
jgi:ABC-2 type transport system permease protein